MSQMRQTRVSVDTECCDSVTSLCDITLWHHSVYSIDFERKETWNWNKHNQWRFNVKIRWHSCWIKDHLKAQSVTFVSPLWLHRGLGRYHRPSSSAPCQLDFWSICKNFTDELSWYLKKKTTLNFFMNHLTTSCVSCDVIISWTEQILTQWAWNETVNSLSLILDSV